jgi:hypothetical protein
MKLNRLTTDEIHSAVTFGAEDTPYIDGALIDRLPDGLHRIRGVFAVDVTNAVRWDDPNAWTLVLSNGEIRPRC